MVSRCVYFKDSDQLLVVSSAATIHYAMLASELTPVVTERYLLCLQLEAGKKQAFVSIVNNILETSKKETLPNI